MGFSDKDFLYNELEKPAFGNSSRLTIDDEGRVFTVCTPRDPKLNITHKEIANPSSELVTRLQERQKDARQMLQRVVFDPQNTDNELRAAADRVWLENSGIDPDTLI